MRLLVHSFLHVNNLPKWHLLLKANTAIVLLLVRWDQRAVQSSCRVAAPHLFQRYYHNMWWERNRSSIRSVGKVATPKTRGWLFEQQAHRGQLGCSVCVCEHVCFVINHCRFEESERRHTLYPSLLFILCLLPHGRWPSHPIWPSHWGQGQPDHPPPRLTTHLPSALSRNQPSPPAHSETSSPHIPPTASPLLTCCPGDSIATETTLYCVSMCVCVAEVRTEAKITDNPTEHRSGYDTMEATQRQPKQQ